MLRRDACGRVLSHRLSAAIGDPLLRSAYSLMLNVVLTSGLGVAFWIAAARLLPSAAVGRDAALVSAMLVVSTVCQLNFSSVILRFLPVSKLSPARVVLGAYGLTALASLLGGVAFVLVAPRVSKAYVFLARDHTLATVYVLAVAAWGVFALQDSVLTALRRAPWVPLENGVFGALKIAALPALLALSSQHAVFISWVVPMILLVVPVNYFIFKRLIPTRASARDELSPVERFGWRGLIAFMVNDYLATIFIQAASTLLPVLVVGLIGTAQGAYFYVPFTMVSAFDLLFVNVASSMTVEASLSHSRLPQLVCATVRKFGGFLFVGVLVLVAGAGLILLPYGGAYVHAGVPVLRVLACASVFRAVVTLYAAICRVEGHAGRGMAVHGGLFTVVIALTFALGHNGIVYVGYVWLTANCIAAVVVSPKVARTLSIARGSGPAAPLASLEGL